ncbi:MAG: hypothetical protein JWR08_1725 [Enterovirga sp.]|nr:hypothetical protein [Enterovirga sp.]
MSHTLLDHVGTPAGDRQGSDDPAAKALSPAARRALDEAAARRAEIDRRAAAIGQSPEQNGRGGLDPVRYDDWEIAGRAVDF